MAGKDRSDQSQITIIKYHYSVCMFFIAKAEIFLVLSANISFSDILSLEVFVTNLTLPGGLVRILISVSNCVIVKYRLSYGAYQVKREGASYS